MAPQRESAERERELEAELAAAEALLGEGEPTARIDVLNVLPPSTPPARARNTLVGRYLLQERLGVGGMGEVYAAFDTKLNRKVALKLLLSGNGMEHAEACLRLLREAQAMARLSHRNVLSVYELGEHEGQVFIALELVEGHNLRQWLKAEKRSWSEVVRVLSEAGRGLVAAHAAGLVHRDFKPDNVLVGRDGRVLVFDFGLACEQGACGQDCTGDSLLEELLPLPCSLDTPVTRAGAVMGTPGYMAPEQYRKAPASALADQFSFCATLYLALYGEHAFEGCSAAAIAQATLEGRVRPPPAKAQVPDWLREVVLKGLSVRPEDRYPTLEALLAALQRKPTRRRRDAFASAA
jgi:serine/threonine protein kinase